MVRRFRPMVTRLEDRCTPATFTVTDTGDSGAGTLRQAILDATGSAGHDDILFAIGAAGSSQTISVLSALPSLDDVTIDGWSQGGATYTGPPLVTLTGTLSISSGFNISGTGSLIRGLNINTFGVGIDLSGSSNQIVGCYLGTNQAGTAAAANNYGMIVFGSSNTIGGTGAGEGNLISGNLFSGIQLSGNNNRVYGNFIGVNAAGTAAIGNGDSGINLFAGSNNEIGDGSTAGRNVLSGNRLYGISVNANDDLLPSQPANSNNITGNYIGTNATGTAAIGNGWSGVLVIGASSTYIGENVISGNGFGGGPFRDGITVAANSTSPATGFVQIYANLIGTDAAGTALLGNQSAGVRFTNTGNSTVGILFSEGGDSVGNTIAGNDVGLAITGENADNIDGVGNTFFSNTRLAIDLGDDGPTLNDSDDADTGPNDLLNMPVLQSVSASGTSRTVSGFLQTAPGFYRIDFFANSAYDPTGYGEGAVNLGSTFVTVPATGVGAFSFTYTFNSAFPVISSAVVGFSGLSEMSSRNLAPVNTVPGPLTANEDLPLEIGSGNFFITDNDNDGLTPMRLTMSVQHGTLTLGSTIGLTFVGGANGSASFTVEGTLSDLNNALDGSLIYQPDSNYSGPDLLTFTTNDGGPLELGGPAIRTDTVDISVTPDPDPVNATSVSGVEGQPIALLLSLQDADGSEVLRLNGVPTTGVTFSAGTNLGSGIWEFTVAELVGLTITVDDGPALLMLVAHSRETATSEHGPATSFQVGVSNADPSATLTNNGPRAIGGIVTLTFVNPTDPSMADLAAGLTYRYDFDGDGFFDRTSSSPSESFTYNQAGYFFARGQIEDKDGGLVDLFTQVKITVAGIYATGAGAGGGPHVRVYDSLTGAEKFSFFAYNPRFQGGVRVATGDITGDGQPDIATAAGVGGGPHMKVFDGVTGNLIWEFMAYAPGFTGGVHMALGDFDDDGYADLICGAGSEGAPHVTVWSGRTRGRLASFMAYDPRFLGGVRVAAGDLNGDGRADIITAPGLSGGPHIKAFDGRSQAEFLSFYGFNPAYDGGLFIATGDVNGDHREDIIASADVNGGPHVRAFDGRTGGMIGEFFAFEASFTGGVRVAAEDLNNDGRDEIMVAAGTGGRSRVIARDLVRGINIREFRAYDPGFLGSVFISASPGGVPFTGPTF